MLESDLAFFFHLPIYKLLIKTIYLTLAIKMTSIFKVCSMTKIKTTEISFYHNLTKSKTILLSSRRTCCYKYSCFSSTII